VIPHVKLFVLDFINFGLSLLSEKDRRTLIHDLSEQQRVIDAKKVADAQMNGQDGNDAAARVIEEYM